MRPIKFRAKRIDNGEWVEGHYTVDANYRHVIWNKKENWQVDESTLGQFIGSKDKNDVDIVEWDVVKYRPFANDREIIGTIEWAEKSTCFYFRSYDTTFTGRLLDGRECMEVIGNVIDNKELLS